MAITNNDNYTLQNVAEQHSYIDEYIITPDPYVVGQYDSRGSIVILTQHDGDAVTLKDETSTTYTDLYIGDEHVAGGFGFKNTAERTYVMTVINSYIPELADKINEIYENGTGSSGSNEAKTNITLSDTYRYIKTNDAKYALELDDVNGILAVTSDIKESIDKLEVIEHIIPPVGDEYWINKPVAPELQLNKVGVTSNISYITFEYTGNTEVKGFYFTYSFEVDPENRTTTLTNYPICGSLSNYYSPDDNDNNDYFEANNQYILADPDLDPCARQEKWRIDFKDKFLSVLYTDKRLHSQQHIVNLYLNVVLQNRRIAVPFIRLAFLPPIFYRIGEQPSYDGLMSDSIGVSSTLTPGDGRTLELTFVHDQHNTLKDYIFIPTTICGKAINVSGENSPKFVFEPTEMKFTWTNRYTRTPLLNNGEKINYRVYESPQIYGSTVTWLLTI